MSANAIRPVRSPDPVRRRSIRMSKVAPLADRVVVKPLEEAEQMRGGLYIPDTAK
ncbi:MAG: co-chaperone GroES, partial [Gemmatimonas sp.]